MYCIFVVVLLPCHVEKQTEMVHSNSRCPGMFQGLEARMHVSDANIQHLRICIEATCERESSEQKSNPFSSRGGLKLWWADSETEELVSLVETPPTIKARV